MSQGITYAFWVGAISLVGKIAFDIFSAHQTRRSVAAAIAGELGAYMELLNPNKTLSNLRAQTLYGEAAFEKRTEQARAMHALPNGHPVFDRIADKIGSLTPEAAQRVSEAYNVVTGGRLMLGSFYADPFLDLPREIQQDRMQKMLDLLEPALLRIPETVDLLNHLSHQGLFSRVSESVRNRGKSYPSSGYQYGGMSNSMDDPPF